ncbi:MAG: YfcC family protein [Saprospiraceae bacterium]|nr:YfcC family protein [Saprospiraceae bacterium]
MKKLTFPTAHTILLILAAIVAVSTWIIPSGKYDTLGYDEETNMFVFQSLEIQETYPATQETLDNFGIRTDVSKFTNGDIWKPVGIPGTYQTIPSNKQGLVDFILSPLKGIMEAIDVVLFVLIIGGFIGVVHFTGVFDAGVGWLAKRLQGRETLLIVIITSLIALGGTTFGLAEETIAFYPILVPVFLAARYDALVAVASIYVGSSVGTMCSTINPFSVIIASDAAGINWTAGSTIRVAVLLLCLMICLWYIIRYAERVRKNPEKSIIYKQQKAIEAKFLSKAIGEVNTFTWRSRLILTIFAMSFVVMIYGVSQLDWWFMEMTAVFFVASIIIAFVARLKEKVFIENFIKGASDLLSVALIIGIARGITVLMDDGAISDSLLYYSSSAVEGMPKGIFMNMMLFIFGGLSFFVPSSSGLAVLSMPIMAPLGDFVDLPRELIVNSYVWGAGLMAFITPTGLILPSLTMVDVTYDKWIKFILPLLGILTLFIMIVLILLVYL